MELFRVRSWTLWWMAQKYLQVFCLASPETVLASALLSVGTIWGSLDLFLQDPRPSLGGKCSTEELKNLLASMSSLWTSHHDNVV